MQSNLYPELKARYAFKITNYPEVALSVIVALSLIAGALTLKYWYILYPVENMCRL